ncbi:MAG: response regulator [Lachnospiraceae bacterium]|nr:response regulator [Lachnospiraceae bacterium]
MAKEKHTIFIADDEKIIRQGLMCIIDWEELHFEIIGEAANGEDASHFILERNPDVVMLDIRMPKKNGLDVVKEIREKGYQGKIIILSGHSEFKYAQTAIRYGVEYYLTKPIDETELYDAIKEIRENLEKETKSSETMEAYRDKTRAMVLYDVLIGQQKPDAMEAFKMHLDSTSYQVVIYESYSHKHTDMKYPFFELLKVTENDTSSYEHILLDKNEVILLKGEDIQKKFQKFIEHYEREQKPQENSPLDSLFIAYGRVVNDPKDLSLSYKDAAALLERRFFCENHQHTIGYERLPDLEQQSSLELNEERLQDYCRRLIGFIQITKRNQVAETLQELQENLYNSKEDIHKIKLFLTDLYLSIKEKIAHLYHNLEIPFPSNTDIISNINDKYYLYEIILFFTEQFEMIMQAIGTPTTNNIMDDIIYYIEHNYMDNIKLETIAPLFGYNSSYLGKIFAKKAGIGFNMFVDQIRVEKSKELLQNTDLKVYEIAEKVGYRNVDYFHTKFKKYMNQSPAEYRKQYEKEI